MLNRELNTEIWESGSRQKDNRLQLWFQKCLGMLRQKASDYNTLAITYTLAPHSLPLPTSSLQLYCGEPATLRSSCSSQVAVLSMYLLESSCIGHSGPINSVAFNHDSDLMDSGGTSALWFITQELIKCQQAMTVTWWSGSVRMVNAFTTSHCKPIPCPQSALGQKFKDSHEQSVSAVVGAAKMFNTSLPHLQAPIVHASPESLV